MRIGWGHLIATLVVVFFLWLAGLILVGLSVDAECKRLGWKSGDITWRFERFCTSRINQTDVVVSLDRAGERRP